MTSRTRLLVVDDEAGIRDSLSSILEDEGYQVEAVGSAEEALERAAAGDFEVVLLDVWLPGIDGLEALGRLQASTRPPAIIMISGHVTIETAVRATKLGAFDFIEKPLSLEKIIVLVRNAIQRRRLEDENQLLRSELGYRYQVIGDSIPMKALRQQIAVTAPTNGRVLIYGESGTGKELVARSLHAASLRGKGPFVEVNCAAIPEELIESELFGHIKGSFTGATEDKVGKFQKADGGTLFLDEIGDMSLRTQSKVLRVLEEQHFERVGSNETLSVDVRVIAATNKHLEQEIARGAFRQDLFYRLNVIPFYVPALRDRKGRSPRWPGISWGNSVPPTERNCVSSAIPLPKFLFAIPGQEMSANCEILSSGWLLFALRRASSRITFRPSFSVGWRKAPIILTQRCTRRAAPTSANSSCANCRSIAGT